jgi:glycylpeptide N-tetradecanoyltransferase
MTLARMIRQHKVPDTPTFAKSGLREMTETDIPEVLELYTRYMKRFDMAPIMTKEEITHQFLSGKGRGEISAELGGKREGQVVWSYVVEVSSAILSSIMSTYRQTES